MRLGLNKRKPWTIGSINDETLSDTAEILADWEKARNGGISFKDFADKWMPYLEEDLTQNWNFSTIALADRIRLDSWYRR